MLCRELKVPFRWRRHALAVSFLMLAAVGCKQETEEVNEVPVIRPVLVEILTVQTPSDLVFNGVVQASQRADLAFRVGGRIESILVSEGDSVTKGQELAQLDDREAKSALKDAELELNKASQEFNRAKTVFDKTQAISKADLDALRTKLNLASNKAQDARERVEYTKLVAPFDGVIGEKIAESFTQVQANQAIMTLQDVDNLEVEINIPNRVMLSGVRNTKALATLAAIPDDTFDLTLRTYSTQADRSSQTYSVVLGFDDLKGYRVLPGMSVRVFPSPADTSSTLERIVTLPLSAVVPDNQGQQFVWVVSGENKVEKRFVELGTVYNDRVVIKNNVTEGEQVVIAGVSSMTESTLVRPYVD